MPAAAACPGRPSHRLTYSGLRAVCAGRTRPRTSTAIGVSGWASAEGT